MDQDLAVLVSRLETRIRQMMLQYDKLNLLLTDAKKKLAEQEQRCNILEEEKRVLEEQYAVLKMARLMDMADNGDLRTTRKRINKMIASVDKCLATLKVQ